MNHIDARTGFIQVEVESKTIPGEFANVTSFRFSRGQRAEVVGKGNAKTYNYEGATQAARIEMSSWDRSQQFTGRKLRINAVKEF